MKWWDWMPWSLFFECWVISQLFQSQPHSLTQWNYEPCHVGQPNMPGHGGGFQQNLVHWKRECQTTSVFLLLLPDKQYEKAKKIRHWKMNSPGLIGAQYATGEEWRNSSRKNEEAEPKQKQCLVVDETADGSQVRCCKEQYCLGTLNVRPINQCKLEVILCFRRQRKKKKKLLRFMSKSVPPMSSSRIWLPDLYLAL